MLSLSYVLLKLFVLLIYVVSHIYDYISYPIYWVYYHPWRVRRYRKSHHARLQSNSSSLVYHSVQEPGSMNILLIRNSITTLLDIFEYIVKTYGESESLGTREFISEDSEVQPNGKVFKKYNLGKYIFISFNELERRAEWLRRGLSSLGIHPFKRLAILAETRQEWMISAFAAFKNNIAIVTLYTNLGEEGMRHVLIETEVPLVICSQETLFKIKGIASTLPSLQSVIVMKSLYNGVSDLTSGFPSSVTAFDFDDVVKKGKDSQEKYGDDENTSSSRPSPSDPAIIMYTSGSTGVPKGVILSHKNLLSSLNSLLNIANFKAKDRYIAYLPLAHVLELIAELTCLLHGIKIGYSTSLTLTNKSSKIKEGCKGDANIFKPTLMCAVPLILERIYKSVVETMRRQGWAAEELFHYFVAYKMKWEDRGFDTPMLNKTLFRKIRYFLGGKVRLLLSGGAPLSSDTHSLTRTVICVPLLQGYGLTETSACATVSSAHDRTTGRAGAPLYNTKIKLVNWEEGNYCITDTPFPRGEIHIGGDNVGIGYFKNQKQTLEDFYEDSEGTRWFKTGDIGKVDDDGVLSIIDRKKDLVKLQQGEYISYGKIETILKTCPIVENICAYADPSKDHLMCIVIPDKKILHEISKLSSSEAVKNKNVIEDVLKKINTYGLSNGLLNYEIPKALLLVNDEWTPDNGLVTAAFKIRRRFIFLKYEENIKNIY